MFEVQDLHTFRGRGALKCAHRQDATGAARYPLRKKLADS